MLDLAYKYEAELRKLMYDTWYDEKYMYYYICYRSPYSCPNDGDWNKRQFVSLNSKGEIIGFIHYDIDREYDYIECLGAINFTDNKVTFGRDLAQVLDDIFCKFNMRKLNFYVIVGNPIEKTYDKMITKYNGRIVGIKKQHAKLMDNQFHDLKLYEIFREDYIAAKEKHHGK